MPPRSSFDLAVVGAGIVGLGCAMAAAKQGKSVAVIDRDFQANGASVRNFGLITVTGQQQGYTWNLARRTRDLWCEVSTEAQVPILQNGLILTVRRPESVAVLEAFINTEMGEECHLLTGSEIRRSHPELATSDVLRSLWSPHELRVESREAIPKLAAWLTARHDVQFFRGTAALDVKTSRIVTSCGVVRAEAIAVCPGDDMISLFPEQISAYGLTRCRLQMLRLADPGYKLATGVMSDLGLTRYAGYAALSEVQSLRARLEIEQPEHLAHGVHLIAVQSADGTLVVGDSHRYAATPHPFSSDAVDELILSEFKAVFAHRAPPILERWSGTYVSAPSRQVLIDTPTPGVRLVMVTTGAGASIGFALGEEIVADLFGTVRHDG